ncbi:MAG: AbrB/MazE/SpoVT family DNA-binding domain-containing protein [Candidatus Aminicenantes bacterium]|nr:MAG: AbrB/MazE/SpoVT family DNA-binding domain-containing protein [Candidatus Aminicenantes bacterium]
MASATLTLTSRGQITIPQKIRKALHLETNDKITILVKNDTLILKPIKGNILDIGASIKIPGDEKPINFKKVRKQVIDKIAREAEAKK